MTATRAALPGPVASKSVGKDHHPTNRTWMSSITILYINHLRGLLLWIRYLDLYCGRGAHCAEVTRLLTIW